MSNTVINAIQTWKGFLQGKVLYVLFFLCFGKRFKKTVMLKIWMAWKKKFLSSLASIPAVLFIFAAGLLTKLGQSVPL